MTATRIFCQEPGNDLFGSRGGKGARQQDYGATGRRQRITYHFIKGFERTYFIWFAIRHLDREAEPGHIIEVEHRCLDTGGGTAFCDGRKGISLQFDGPAIPDLCYNG